MATRVAYKRLSREYKVMQENPTPYIEAQPSESNILEWHYVVTGPPDTPYEGGQYHGVLIFPADYPFKPPAIKMLTPSGRFTTNVRLCLSISDYHPRTWDPAWSVSTILIGLLSFMVENETTTGSMVSTDSQKRQYAKDSFKWNLEKNAAFKQHFPQLAAKTLADLETANKAAAKAAQASKTAKAAAGKNTSSGATSQTPVESAATGIAATAKQGRLSMRQKMFCAAVLVASWLMVSQLLDDS